MDCQTVFAESLRHNFHDALGIVIVTKPNHEVIRITDEEGTTSQTRFHFLLEPLVQHLLQKHVRK
jgi:hypothetical protein